MAGRGIVIKIEGDGESARRALEMVREQLSETADASREAGGVMSEAFERATRALEYAGLYMGIREAVDSIKELVKGSVDLGVELAHLSQQTGISTENLSIMKYMSEKTGVGFEELTKSFRKFSVEILGAEEGKKQAIQTFQRLGISQQDVKQHSSDMLGMLGLVADRFKTIPDGPNKSAEAVALFGRSGMAMIPILNQGRDGIAAFGAEARSLGIVLDENTVEKMEKLHAKTVELKGAFDGAGVGITSGLEPALMSLMTAFVDAATDGNGMVDVGKKLGDTMLGAANSTAYLVMFIRQAKAEAESLDSHLDHPFEKFDAKFGFTQGQRDSAAGRSSADEQESRDAVKEYQDARDDYEKFANELAKGLSSKPDYIVGPGMSKAEHQRQLELQKQLRDIQLQDQSGGAKSGNGIAQANSALVAEQAKAAADAQKDADTVALAQLDEHHKEMLVSEQQYLAEKLKLQLDEIDAEMKALQGREAGLEALYQKQHGDKTLKRDKDGNSAEELRTMRELEQVWDQMNAAAAKYQSTVAASGASAFAANQAAELGNLKAAAELEKQRNDGITAQIALLERETQLEVQKAAAAGQSGDAQAQIRANGQVLEQKLRIADVDRQIQQVEEEFNTAAKEVEDKAAKGQMSKLAAERQLNALHQQEVAVLQSLVQQYDALAATLGGPFVQKAQELHAALSELSTPDKSKEPQFGKTVGEGITKMADTLVSQSIRGKESFRQMVKEMEADAAELALKLLTLQLVGKSAGGGGAGGGGGGQGGLGGLFTALFSHLPQFGGGGGGGGATSGTDDVPTDNIPGFASGTDNDPDRPQVVGEEGPELWRPPVSGGSITPNGMLSKLAQTGGGGRAPNVTTNVINQSSQPVTAQNNDVSYSNQLHEFTTNVVLKDLASNGPIRQAFSGSMG